MIKGKITLEVLVGAMIEQGLFQIHRERDPINPIMDRLSVKVNVWGVWVRIFGIEIPAGGPQNLS